MPALRIVLIVILALVLLVICGVALGRMLFRRPVASMAESLFAAGGKASGEIITEADLIGLPAPVVRWLRYSNVVGRERVRSVRLRQKGELRQSLESAWMPFEGVQYYTTNPPAFLWYADVRLGIIPFIQGRDSYIDGRGHMLISLGGWITVADGRGPRFDQGSLLRYLSEIIWFPGAVLETYITWSPVDDRSARATMSYEGVTASALFLFDDMGRPVDMIAERYYSGSKGESLETWSTPSAAYGEFHGVKIPMRGEAIWKLKSGDLSYINVEIVDVEYNVPMPY